MSAQRAEMGSGVDFGDPVTSPGVQLAYSDSGEVKTNPRLEQIVLWTEIEDSLHRCSEKIVRAQTTREVKGTH